MASAASSSSSTLGKPELNAGGALDVIVVVQPDGSLRSTDWHVVFEMLATPADVAVHINGERLETALALRASAPLEPASFARSDGAAAAVASALPPPSVLAALAASKLLKPGRNELRYTAGAAGGPCVRAFMYLWRHAAPAVIFDIDGTVTLSDVAGHVGAVFDASPTHEGVCELVCHLHARGYHVLYLSSRTLLGGAGIERTRRFLFDVAVDEPSRFKMPQAPVITTTHCSTVVALMSEVRPHSRAEAGRAPGRCARRVASRRRARPPRIPTAPPHRARSSAASRRRSSPVPSRACGPSLAPSAGAAASASAGSAASGLTGAAAELWSTRRGRAPSAGSSPASATVRRTRWPT